MSSDLRFSLRRIKPQKRRRQLTPRPESALAFLEAAQPPLPKLLPDTTVYIDVLQGTLAGRLTGAEVWHSTVTEAEMAALCGRLDPWHGKTPDIVRQLVAAIDRRPAHRILAPDRSVWQEAGILSGLLARLQGYAAPHRQRVLNDALIFCTALQNGCTVLTRNVRDFDLLQQLMPAGKVLFYRQAVES